MANLGSRPATGVKNLTNPLGAGFWTVAFDPKTIGIQIQYEIYHIAISGPSGSAFQVYIENEFYDYVARGDINSWDPAQPMHMRPGSSLFFYWNTSSGSAPTVSISCREPSVL